MLALNTETPQLLAVWIFGAVMVPSAMPSLFTKHMTHLVLAPEQITIPRLELLFGVCALKFVERALHFPVTSDRFPVRFTNSKAIASVYYQTIERNKGTTGHILKFVPTKDNPC